MQTVNVSISYCQPINHIRNVLNLYFFFTGMIYLAVAREIDLTPFSG